MTELSNAVTVLIARMESHPEDFAVDDGELYSKSKFGEMVTSKRRKSAGLTRCMGSHRSN